MTDIDISKAIRHLRRADPVMKSLIERHGSFPAPVLVRNDFDTLAGIIIGQQLSGNVADTIFSRIRATAGGRRLTVQKLAKCSDAQLRQAGVSRPKINALRSLIEHVATRKLQISRLNLLPDETVFEKITQVRGMGPWSAQMYLMFVLVRPDIFPENDLGIRKAISRLYAIDLTPDSLAAVSEPWRPYRTVASFYLWRSLENRP